MSTDRSFVGPNRAASARMRALAGRLTDEQLQHPVGEHWTVAIALAHIAFWEQRALLALDQSEREGALNLPSLNIFVNDVSLPLWAAMPPREAVRIALETADELDARLENYPEALLAQFYAEHPGFLMRDVHRNRHLDEVDAALREG